MLSSFYRIIKFAAQNFWRNIWLSLITITILVLMLISINCLIVVNVLANTAITSIKDKIDLSIYFKPEVNEAQVANVKAYLASFKEIESVGYISQTEALEQFKKRHQDNPLILESLSELKNNPLGATLVVKTFSTENYQKILQALDNSQFKELVLERDYSDYQLAINKINVLARNIGEAGLAISLVFLLTALIVVFNTIRVGIYTHREEIGVMKLVGASNWFVRAPFFAESIFYSLVACSIAVGITYFFLNLSNPYLQSFFQDLGFNITAYFNSNFLRIFGGELLGVIALNLLASSVAIRKYLKV